MQVRAWLILSLGLNVLLGASWYSLHLRHKPIPEPPKPAVKKTFNPFDFYVRTNVVVRRQYFTWEEVESSDYETYINNLRTIGCPEQTIRDIIVADVDQLYAYRRATEIVTNDFQWWRSEPDLSEIKKRVDRLKSLEEERRTSLTKLLGPNWERSSVAVLSTNIGGISLSGPLLGELSPEAKQNVYGFVSRAEQRRVNHIAERKQLGLPPDPGELARLQAELRTSLAQILSPEQFEEFLLRYADAAKKLRQELKGANVTPEEFRTLFRVLDPVESEIALLGKETNPSIVQRLKSLRLRFEAAMKHTLGAERYSALKLNQDPLFQKTRALAEKAGVPKQVMISVYEINQATEAERQRVRNDPTLSSTEKIDAMAGIQADQQRSLENLMGAEAFRKWVDLQESR